MKKRIISYLIMFFLAFTICLTGCSPKGLKDNPPLEADVVSNGGMAVVKGDYLYFCNGYVDENTLTKDDNKSGKVVKGAIYRTKLDDNEIQKDKDGFLTNAERVVSRVVGFGNGGFSIIDNTIYYVTPYMKFSSSGELQSNRVEFHKVNIDGTNDKALYTTTTSETNLDWSVFKVGDKTYIVVYEDSKIVSFDASNGNVVGKVEGSTSYAILDETEYKYGIARNDVAQNYVIYTRANDSSKLGYKGNEVCLFNIATGETTVLESSRDNTYTIKHVNKNVVYYTKSTTVGSESTIECLYKKDMSNWTNNEEVKLTNRNYTSYYFLDYGNDYILANDDSSTWLLEGSASVEPVKVLSTARDIVTVANDKGYYVVENVLVSFDIFSADSTASGGRDSQTVQLENPSQIDFDGRRLYVYASYQPADENAESVYYLDYIEIDANNDVNERFVGVFEDKDLPKAPEQEEHYGEEGYEDIEYKPHID